MKVLTNSTNRKTDSDPKSKTVLETRNLSIYYDAVPAVENVSVTIPENAITAIIGPSGCGKSTLLRSLNRMNDFVPNATMSGKVLYRSADIYGKGISPVEIRLQIGMVFQKPNPFPKTIYKNLTWGPLINGFKGCCDTLVENSLRDAALWNEAKDRLQQSAMGLSGGQQQRLCIARALAMEPDVILMDEPCSALDPVSTAKIEDLMFEIKKKYTIVIVTHNMQQAARVSDFTVFMENGHIVEAGETEQIFTRPQKKRTEEYVTGRFG